MMKSLRIIFPMLVLGLLGVGLLSPSDKNDPRGQGAQVKWHKSDKVVQDKIARKQAKLDGSWMGAKNALEYDKFRAMARPHPEGSNIKQLLLDAKREVESMPRVQADKDAGVWGWQWLGPGNIGGRVRAVMTHPTEPDILWAGSAGGGIWKTIDGGAYWVPQSDFLPSLAVTSLAMDPTNSDVIFAGTGEGFGNASGLPGAGLFKSNNGGDSWFQLPTTSSVDAYYLNDVAHHPVNSGWLLFCGLTSTGAGRVWRTEDGGSTWSITLTIPNPTTDVKYDLENPSVAIVGTSDGAYRSDDAGLNWVSIADGSAGKLPANPGRCEFAFGQGTDVVYASCNVPRADPDSHKGEIWRSMDNGITWLQRSTFPHLATQGSYDNVIWVEPGSTGNIMVGGVSLYKSSDGGITLSLMNTWQLYHAGSSAHADQHAIVPHIYYGNGNNGTIYFGNDGGVQKTTLGFATEPLVGWVNLANNLGVTQFYHADANADGSIILGGSQDNDDLRYTASGGAQSWFQAETGDGTYNAINPSDNSIMYGCYPLLQMQRSTDWGWSYDEIDVDITESRDKTKALFLSPFALDKVNPQHLLAGGTSVWRSNNEGTNWHVRLTPRPGAPKVSSIEISPTVGIQVAWVGYNNGQLWKSENDTGDWTQVEAFDGPMPNAIVTDIEISPHDPSTVAVTFGGYFGNRVWITTDGGATWSDITGSGANILPSVQASCVSFHPTESNWIYVGMDIGLFASEDMGQNWNVTTRYDFGEGPVNTEIADLIWHSGDTLVAVTHGRGMYACRPLAVVWVDQANSGSEDGSLAAPFDTFGEGYNFIGNGSTLAVDGGDYIENGIILNKRITLQGTGIPAVIR